MASTCSTSLVPIPKASAPNAPCVDVWLSPHTIVIPGWVRPCSGPMTCTMPCPGVPMGYRRMPNSAQFGRAPPSARRRWGRDRLVDADRRHVVVHRGDGEVGAAYAAAGQTQAVERLRRRHLVHEVQVDVEQVGLALGPVDHVALPHLLAERRGAASLRSVCHPRFCQPACGALPAWQGGPRSRSRRSLDVVIEIPRAAATSTSTTTRRVMRLDRASSRRPSTRPTTASCRTRSRRTATRSARWCCSRTRRSRAVGCGSALGVFWMEDEKGADAKLICVPSTTRSTSRCRTSPSCAAPARRDRALLQRLQDARARRPRTHTRGYEGRDAAWAEIDACRQRFE